MATKQLTTAEKESLLKLARETIAHTLRGTSPPSPSPEELTPRLKGPGAAFVTLHKSGALRGCIGSLVARRPLYEDVQANALAAAFEDPRFPALRLEELADTEIEISVLSAPEPLDYEGPDDLLRKLRPNVDGVVLARGFNRATFLPQVWAQLPQPVEFLAHLCYKAGLPPDAWRSPGVKISTYQVEEFEEGHQ